MTAARGPMTGRQRGVLAAAAGAVLVLAAVVLWAVLRDDDADDVASDSGETTTTVAGETSTTSTDASPTTTTETATTTRPAPGRPETFVAVRADGTLVVVGEGGATTELVNRGDPNDQPEEGGPYYIYSVVLDREGERVVYEFCCEPAGGLLEEIPLSGGEPQMIDHGYHPAVSADGRWLLFPTYTGVRVIDTVSGDVHDIDGGESHVPGGGQIALSPDEETIAVGTAEASDQPGRILLVDRTAAALDEATELTPPPGTSWSFPAFRSDGSLVVAEHDEERDTSSGVVIDPSTGEVTDRFDFEGPVVGLAYDDSGTWLIYVTRDRVVRYRGLDEQGVLAEGYYAADW